MGVLLPNVKQSTVTKTTPTIINWGNDATSKDITASCLMMVEKPLQAKLIRERVPADILINNEIIGLL